MLTKVVQRRCERRDCSLFLIPVASGEVCQAEGCGRPLAIRRKLHRWVPFAAGGILVAVPLLVLYGGNLSSWTVRAEAPATTLPATDAQSLTRGEALARSGRYEEARAEFERAVAEAPRNPIAWADLGAANAKTGRPREARSAYSKALGLAPDNWLAHYNLAVLLAREGDRKGALQHLEGFFSHTGSLPEARRLAIVDLRRDPRLRKLLDDPRISVLAGGAQ